MARLFETRATMALMVAVGLGCQGNGGGATAGSGSAAGSATSPVAGSATGSGSGSAIEVTTANTGTSSSAVGAGEDGEVASDADIAALGAIPAWQAVVDRANYLRRRGQRGVVAGVIGGPVVAGVPTGDPPDGGSGSAAPAAPGSAGFGSGAPRPSGPALTWLVDDTEGGGSLAIRVAFTDKIPAVGTRVAVGGAWTVTDERVWYWQADALSRLPASTTPAPATATPRAPGHVVGTGDPPAGAKPVTKAKDNGIITFQIVGPPDGEGDGWRIANELGDKPAAVLYLPGERISYGGLDLRAADERWTLKRGTTYWVPIGRVKKRTGDLPPLMYAQAPPTKW